MKILKVKLSNWCQHKDREFAFIPGLNGILGRNGSGKSNLLRAIPRALMPGLASSIGVKEDDVSWGAENGKIVVEFEHGGVAYSLTRAVKGSSSNLKWGKEKISGAAAVDEKMRALLGVGSRVFNEIIFVAQEDLTGIIFQRPADRTKTFHALLGLDNAEKIRELIANKLSMMPADSCLELIAQLEAKKALVDKEIAEVATARAGVQTLSAAERKELQDLTEAYSAWLRQEVHQGQVRAELKLINESDLDLGADLTRQRYRVDALTPLLSDLADDYEDAKRRCAELEDVARVAQARAMAEKDLDEANAVLADCVVPPPSPDEEVRNADKRAADVGRQYNEVCKILKALEAGGAVCPTCRKPILAGEIESYRKSMSSLCVLVREAQAELCRLTAVKVRNDVAIREAEHRRASYGAKKAAAIQTLANLPNRRESSDSIEDYKAIVTNYEELRTERAAKQARIDEIAAQRDVLQTRRQALEASRVETQARVDRGDAERADRVLEDDNSRLAQAANLDGQLEALRRQAYDHEASIQELRNREAGLSKVRATRALMEEARGVLHRDCLPAVAARAFLTSLNQSLAKQLHEFSAEFAARINDDLSFDCIFDGNVVSARRLSGGQKVTLAIATQFALYDLLAENLGILVLDEPSVYLDTDHIDCLTDLLEKVKTRAVATGLQVIVVTHEDRLKRVFDKAIEL